MTGQRKQPVRSLTFRLPSHPFLYTVDQVAIILSISEAELKRRMYLIGRTQGRRTLDQIEAFNIAPDNTKRPDWRISERELLRWMARRGYSIERE